MRGWICLLAVTLLFCGGISPAGAENVTINATPTVAHIGDMVTLSGTVSGIRTIAVYLFSTGPDLDSRGVTLENLNIPAARSFYHRAGGHE